MVKPTLPFLETMITQACNLNCVGCTNYSDLVHRGYEPWEIGKHQLLNWLTRIEIPDFGIMGGEPLMNPEVRQWLQGTRDIMPHSQIRFTTNGILLDKHFDIIDVLADIGNCVFKITVHENDTRLEDTIATIFKRYNWTPITEYGIDRYVSDNGFRFHVKRPTTFYKTFKGTYENMMPHDNSPKEAFASCIQQQCPLLYKGKIYKCSSNGLLVDTLLKFNNPNYIHWEKYITDGIGINTPDVDLLSFIENFGKPNSMCGMCPTNKNADSVILHLDNVSRKKYIPSNF